MSVLRRRFLCLICCFNTGRNSEGIILDYKHHLYIFMPLIAMNIEYSPILKKIIS
jgi:hypothetical protein